MNILILSCGTRNKVVQYFKNELKTPDCNVVACDCSKYAPALYEADKHYILPIIDSPNYIDMVLDICKNENINAVLSLIDPELSLLALNKSKFDSINVKLINSSLEACELSLDKYKMYLKMKELGYKCARSYISLNEFKEDLMVGIINFPVFVKPVKGSASLEIQKIDNMNTLDFVFKNHKDLMIQEFLQGQEIGADCYIDLISQKTVSIFLKEKLKMRAGETDKAVSFKDDCLFELIKKFISDFGFEAQIDIDIFKVNKDYYFSEVNPRFGGGYPHAHECGANHIKLIINNVNNISNDSIIANYKNDMIMMKYNELLVIDNN